MKNWWAHLMVIDSSDEDVQRRGRTVVMLALGLIVVLALAVPLFLTQSNPIAGSLAVVGAIVLFAGALLLARHGHVALGAMLIIAATIAAPAGAGLAIGSVRAGPTFFVLAPLIAGVVLRPWQIWLATACSIAALIATAFIVSQSAPLNEIELLQIRNAIIVGLIAALVGTAGARSATATLRLARAARAHAEQSATALEQANADLEQRVAERTNALSTAFDTQQAQYQELQESLAAQRRLNEVVATLSLPIIPIENDVLVVPLVGNIDSARAEQLLASVLVAVQSQRARAIILDVTGIAIVDTYVAQALLRTASATRLLGARTILVGIRPEMAQTLVGLGVDLRELSTAATLRDGLSML